MWMQCSSFWLTVYIPNYQITEGVKVYDIMGL
jgi:hypothetical protein